MKHPAKSNSIKIVPEASPPLDQDNQLKLDDSLAALGEQLRSEAQWLDGLAQDRQADPLVMREDETLQQETLQQMAAQLTAESRRLHQAAGPMAPPSGQAWRTFLKRLLPLAAAAGLLVIVWAAGSTESPDVTMPAAPAVRPSVAQGQRRVPDAQIPPLDPFAPSAASPETIAVPWQQLSSPELEGALDLVDEVVTISI